MRYKVQKQSTLELVCIILLAAVMVFTAVFFVSAYSGDKKEAVNVFRRILDSDAVCDDSRVASALIIHSVNKYAWPVNTDESKWLYETGNFKDGDIRNLYKELGYKYTDKDSDYTACNHFVDVIVYDALGIKMHTMPKSVFLGWGDLPEEFEIVHEGKIGDFKLMPGDIIRYKKNKMNGHRSQHSMIYYGNGLVAEAGIRIRYPVIESVYLRNGVAKWDSEETDLDTLQVIRYRTKPKISYIPKISDPDKAVFYITPHI